MFKLDKNTHIMILFTFAIIFVVVYLYYTILDVRKLQKELKKSGDELAEAKSKITLLEQALAKKEEITKKPSANVIQLTQLAPATQVVAPVPTQDKKDIVIASEVPVKDDESVVTEDIRETLDCSDSDDEVLVEKTPSFIENIIPADDDDDGGGGADEDGQVDTVEDDEDDGLDEILNIAEKPVVALPTKKYQAEDLQKMKYDDLRELCKKNDINPKGTKDALIKKLSEI
jgi:hypothetical protein